MDTKTVARRAQASVRRSWAILLNEPPNGRSPRAEGQGGLRLLEGLE